MNKSYLCIDIGTVSIKAAEKDFSGRILKGGSLKRLDRPFHTNILSLDEAGTIQCLKALLTRMESGTYLAVASLPAFYAFTTVAPILDPKYIPAQPAIYKMDAIRLEDGKYFLVAIPREIIEKYKRIFKAVGLKLVRLELESFALARTHGLSSEPSIIIDVGERSTTFTIAKNGRAELISQTDFSLASQAPNVILEKARNLALSRNIRNVIKARNFSVVDGL